VINIVLVAVSLALTATAVPAMWALTRRWKLERTNFKGKRIPTGFGFLLVLAAAPVYAAMTVLFMMDALAGTFLLMVLGFGILGLLDDAHGTREAGGFRGHLSLLLQGRISTGLIKAVGGGVLGLGVGAVIAGFDPAMSLVFGLTIALMANFLNLLDLRPGRAVSCFWVGVLVLVVTYPGRMVVFPWLIPILVPAVWLTVLDRSARVMMGDAGSNVLGAILGLAIVSVRHEAILVVLLFLIAVHIYAEMYSISELMAHNRVLRGIDRLLGER